MTALRLSLAPAGGMLMLASFFLPWGKTSLMGMDTLTITARDLAERDPGWYLVAMCATLVIVVGITGLIYALTGRERISLYVGAVTLTFSLVAGIFVGRVVFALYNGGINLDWLEGVTAADLNLHLQPGVPLVLLGSALGIVGSLWTVKAAKAALR